MSLEVTIEKQLSGFRLAVEFTADGAAVGLLGPSGSGKSMTLRAIAGLETPDRGRIVLHERVLFDSARRIDVPARARRIGLLFQHYALFPAPDRRGKYWIWFAPFAGGRTGSTR